MMLCAGTGGARAARHGALLSKRKGCRDEYRCCTAGDGTRAGGWNGCPRRERPGADRMSTAGPPVGIFGGSGFSSFLDDVERELGAKLGDLERPDKQRAVRLLRERGAFGLRKSVSAVAEALGVTRFTVYNYLNREAD